VHQGHAIDSDLERRMHRLTKRFGLPRMIHHAVVLGYEVDFLIEGTREAELTTAGYVVVRFTYTMLTRQPQWVASMVHSAFRRWSPVRPS